MEADGPVPGLHSMLSFGAAAVRGEEIVGTFTRNLFLTGTKTDPDTMDFWAKFPDAYKATRTDIMHPEFAFYQLCSWVKQLKTADEIPVFVAFPAGFDFSLMYYYGMTYARRDWWDTFGFQALDIKTRAADVMNKMYNYSGKKYWPKEWKVKGTHTHIALNDAIEQAKQFIKINKSLAQLHADATKYIPKITGSIGG